MAQRALKLPVRGKGPSSTCLRMWTNAQQFAQLYRARMNADLNLETKEKTVEEANKAFEFNMQVLPGRVSAGRLPQSRLRGISALKQIGCLRASLATRQASQGSNLLDQQPVCVLWEGDIPA